VSFAPLANNQFANTQIHKACRNFTACSKEHQKSSNFSVEFCHAGSKNKNKKTQQLPGSQETASVGEGEFGPFGISSRVQAGGEGVCEASAGLGLDGDVDKFFTNICQGGPILHRLCLSILK
jgi:hypothetical protein